MIKVLYFFMRVCYNISGNAGKKGMVTIRKKSIRSILKEVFAFSLRDACVFVVILTVCSLFCLMFRNDEKYGNTYASVVFLLAVFLTSLFTNGYLFGTAASFVSVLIINYFFTYPYSNFNFTLEGYPLTVFCSLVVSIVTSTLVTKIKKGNQLKILAEKEKTRSNLLRAVSHDLRTPLTTILGSTGAIIDNIDVIDDKQKLKLLCEIREESEWLIRMVENLLTVTKIEDGKEASLAKTPEAAEEIVFESVRKFRKRFPDFKVTVKVPEKLIFVPMDAILIQQVIVNILENAVLHAKGATYASVVLSESEGCALFEISDDGCGIPNMLVDSIFDIYRETENSVGSDSKKNMGIGLPVCRTIVKAHSGKMMAYNNSVGGATFSFMLPMQAAERTE